MLYMKVISSFFSGIRCSEVNCNCKKMVHSVTMIIGLFDYCVINYFCIPANRETTNHGGHQSNLRHLRVTCLISLTSITKPKYHDTVRSKLLGLFLRKFTSTIDHYFVRKIV